MKKAFVVLAIMVVSISVNLSDSLHLPIHPPII